MNISMECCPICQIVVETSSKETHCPECDLSLPTPEQQIEDLKAQTKNALALYKTEYEANIKLRWKVAKYFGLKTAADKELYEALSTPDPRDKAVEALEAKMCEAQTRCLEHYKEQNKMTMKQAPNEPMAFMAGFIDGWTEALSELTGEGEGR